MSSDDRKDPVADKDDLQRAVEERVAAVEAAAGTEPVINAPAKKTTRTGTKAAATKKAAAKKAAPVKKAAPAKKAAAKRTPAAKRATGNVAPEGVETTDESPSTASTAPEGGPTTVAPVIAPAPIAEPVIRPAPRRRRPSPRTRTRPSR